MEIMAMEDIKFNFSEDLHVFVFFLPLFTFENDRSRVSFSSIKEEIRALLLLL
jgi:hypothetical protein